MRRTAFSITMIMVLIAGAGFLGCGSGGSGDPLDEGRIRYSVSVTPQNNDEDTPDIDVVQDMCSETEAETFQDFTTKITIVADKNTADLIVKSYEVTFYPIRGTFMTRLNPLTLENFTPPPPLPHPLNGIKRNYTQTKIMAGGTLELEGILIWPAETKLYYVYNFLRDQVGLNVDLCAGACAVPIYQAETASFEYDYRVKLYCRDSERNDFTLEAYGTIVFANYNNC